MALLTELTLVLSTAISDVNDVNVCNGWEQAQLVGVNHVV